MVARQLNPAQKICIKLTQFKGELKNMCITYYNSISQRTNQKGKQLRLVQEAMRHELFNQDLITTERRLKEEYADLLKIEEEHYRSKSKILWLQAGDKNTDFFHRKVKEQNSRNRMLYMRNEEGQKN